VVSTAVLVNHSYRTYQFATALGELEGLEVDTEVLFAAALLHDTGLVLAGGKTTFTLTPRRGPGRG
jgi:HD superfamily phosphodiesterase